MGYAQATAAGTGWSPENEAEYRQVLVPLDGTPFAEAAVRPAAEIATRAGASLRLATAIQRGAGQVVTVEPLPPNALTDVRRAESIEEHLAQVRDRIEDGWDCDVSTEILADARPSEALADLCDEIGADLVVAATHSKGLVERTLLGSTAVDLVGHVDCPTLLVPSKDPEPDPEETPLQGPIDSIVAALGPSSDEVDPGWRHAVALARLLSARLELVQVVLTVPVPDAGGDTTPPVSMKPGLALDLKNRQVAEARLAELATALEGTGIQASWKVLEGPDVAGTLADFVEEGGVDLLVMGRHEMGFLEKIWRGSESDRVHRRVRSSGLLVCPEGAASG